MNRRSMKVWGTSELGSCRLVFGGLCLTWLICAPFSTASRPTAAETGEQLPDHYRPADRTLHPVHSQGEGAPGTQVLNTAGTNQQFGCHRVNLVRDADIWRVVIKTQGEVSLEYLFCKFYTKNKHYTVVVVCIPDLADIPSLWNSWGSPECHYISRYLIFIAIQMSILNNIALCSWVFA